MAHTYTMNKKLSENYVMHKCFVNEGIFYVLLCLSHLYCLCYTAISSFLFAFLLLAFCQRCRCFMWCVGEVGRRQRATWDGVKVSVMHLHLAKIVLLLWRQRDVRHVSSLPSPLAVIGSDLRKFFAVQSFKK